MPRWQFKCRKQIFVLQIKRRRGGLDLLLHPINIWVWHCLNKNQGVGILTTDPPKQLNCQTHFWENLFKSPPKPKCNVKSFSLRLTGARRCRKSKLPLGNWNSSQRQLAFYHCHCCWGVPGQTRTEELVADCNSNKGNKVGWRRKSRRTEYGEAKVSQTNDTGRCGWWLVHGIYLLWVLGRYLIKLLAVLDNFRSKCRLKSSPTTHSLILTSNKSKCNMRTIVLLGSYTGSPLSGI